MKLKNFFKNLKEEFNHATFKGFDFNSKRIKKNYIFFALQGSKFNGNNFITNHNIQLQDIQVAKVIYFYELIYSI